MGPDVVFLLAIATHVTWEMWRVSRSRVLALGFLMVVILGFVLLEPLRRLFWFIVLAYVFVFLPASIVSALVRAFREARRIDAERAARSRTPSR